MTEKVTVNEKEVFSDYFPEAEIEEADAKDVPKEVIEYFEQKSREFIRFDKYKPGNFDMFFVITQKDGKKTYLAQQIKSLPSIGLTEQLTYFAVMKGNRLVGKSELRWNLECSDRDAPFLKGKPMVGWSETDEGMRKKGLAKERLYIMNAFSQMQYGLPLYSDETISPPMRKIWDKLTDQGKATSFKQGNQMRYKLISETKERVQSTLDSAN